MKTQPPKRGMTVVRKKVLTKFDVLGWLFLAIVAFFVLTYCTILAPLASAQELPPPFSGVSINRSNIISTTLTYSQTGAITTTVFFFPEIIFDGTRDVTYLSNASPIDPTRTFDDLPTTPLALLHYWIIKQQLFRAQLIYADCVGQIKAHQKLRNLYPLIDSPLSLGATVTSIRDYTIPFNPIPHPLELLTVIAHIKAAIFTHNITVFHIGLCRSTLVLFGG